MAISRKENIGTLSVQELFFQLIGWLGVRLGVSPVGMVYFMGRAICTWCLTNYRAPYYDFFGEKMFADKTIFTCNLLRQNCFAQ